MVSKISLAKLLFALVLTFSTLSFGRRIWKNLERARRVESLNKELAEAERKNEQLKSELSEKKSLGFVEKEAREKLGMSKSGEKVLILPQEGEEKEKNTILGSSRTTSHWQEWLRVFGF